MFFDETGQAIVTNSFPMVPGLFNHYFQWSRTIKRWNGFYHFIILSVLSSSGSDGKLSTTYHYHCRAIQYGAIIVAGNFLPAEEAEALSLHAMDRANIAMKGLMKWFDEAEEGSNETVKKLGFTNKFLKIFESF